MAFVVNGAEWDFNGLAPAQAEALIDRALEFIAISNEREEEVAVGDDFQTRPMYGGSSLWDLFAPASTLPLSRELSQELAAWLSKAPCYADAEQWPNGFGGNAISIEGAAPVANNDVEWVHFAAIAGSPKACLTLGDARVVVTTSDLGNVDVHFVTDATSRRIFWRHAIILTGNNLDCLLRYAPRAYPDLHLVDGVIADVAKLAGGYFASRDRVQTALAILNDWGHWAFTCPPPAITPDEGPSPDAAARPTNQLIEQRFAGFHLDAAPENPNVRFDRISREAREIILDGRVLYCEWHVKIQGHQNRIHFHPPVLESGDKVVIGVIHEHLPLP